MDFFLIKITEKIKILKNQKNIQNLIFTIPPPTQLPHKFGGSTQKKYIYLIKKV